MEIKESFLQYVDFPFSYAITGLMLFPNANELIMENIVVVSFIAGIIGSSLEVIDPIKRIIVNNIGKEFFYEFEFEEKNNLDTKKKQLYDIGFMFKNAVDIKQLTNVFNKITGMVYLVILLLFSPNRINSLFIKIGISNSIILSFFPYLLVPFVLKYTLLEYKDLTRKIMIVCFYLTGISKDAIDYYHEIEKSLENNDWSRAWSYLGREYPNGRLEFDPEEMCDTILGELKKTWIGKMAGAFGIKMVV